MNKKAGLMGADEYWSMCLCMIFCNIYIQGSWGDVNKVLNKCPNDELYICEGLVNILHVCVLQKCTDAMLHGHMIKHLEMVEMHAGHFGDGWMHMLEQG